MNYSYNKFLRPLTSSDTNIQIIDNSGIIRYTINPFAIINTFVYNNVVKVDKKNGSISIPFSTSNDAKVALTKIQLQIDTLRKKTPILIDKQIENYVSSAISIYERYYTTFTGTFSSSLSEGDVIEIGIDGGLSYKTGQHVIIYSGVSTFYVSDYDSDSAINEYIKGQIDSYNSITGDLSIVITNIEVYESTSWKVDLISADTYYNQPISESSTKNPTDPATTTSLTGVMMGLSASITPVKSGTIFIVISGDMDSDTDGSGAKVQIRRGTGTPPNNDDALTGITVGGLVKAVSSSSINIFPFTLNGLVTGLTLNTNIWVDVSLASITSGTARVRDITITIIEL